MVLVGGIVVAGIIYRQTFHPKSRSEILPQSNVSNPEDSIVDRVSKLMDLPAEAPTLATVTDPAKVADNPFLKESQKGDVVLLYKSIKRVILYRPSTNKIIEVSSVKDDSIEASKSTDIATEPKIARVTILNGTKTKGLAAKSEDRISRIDPSINIVQKSNTVGDNYQTTLVVAIKKEYGDLAVKIAQSLDGKTSSLPKDEVLPENSDILIILGEKSSSSF